MLDKLEKDQIEGKPKGYEYLTEKQRSKWDAYEQGKEVLNKSIRIDNMAIKLDPNRKDFATLDANGMLIGGNSKKLLFDPLKKAIEKLDKPKGFSLTKTLSKMKNVKKHKNSDYILTPINENSITKLDIKKLVQESIKEIKEQAYGHATLTSQGQSIHRAPGVWETDPLGDEDRKQEELIRMTEQPGAQGGPQGSEEEKGEKRKIKEKPPKYSPEKIGECKAKCVDFEIENF